jgi:hypothetical protein
VILHQQNGSLGARSAARRSAVTAQQKPLLAQLRSGGGRELASTSLLNAMVVSSTASQAQALAGNSAVAAVVPNQVIPGPTLPAAQTVAGPKAKNAIGSISPSLCGTPTDPQINP